MLLVVALAGCAPRGGDSAASTPQIAATAHPPSVPVAAGQSLTGTVVEGVEAGCLLLSTPDGDHLLLGADPSVAVVGARVTVRGRPGPAVLTTCQQGTPFLVCAAAPA